jgi:hypothetical protein
VGYQITDLDEAKSLFLCEMQDRLFTGARGSYLMKGESPLAGFAFSCKGELTTFDFDGSGGTSLSENEEAIILISKVHGVEFQNDADMAATVSAYHAGIPIDELSGVFSAIVSCLHSRCGLTRILQSRIRDDGSLSDVLDTGAYDGENKKSGFLFFQDNGYNDGNLELTTWQSHCN